ncbi:beta-1,3-galactosyltransferase 1-like [Mytilus californianus]|uniref:beta-1,3-galactosyltransferase 1-like n=1 Tax=Mytilus californianus TaxID=6549 RepID=UPI002244FEA6|nr:beta-1,3-galactosyltransferase 1-like [Mytilus californianus]XP_052062063.1 beta-1,3-galactosyltransferase 1-like [Mytilus californianus]
MLKYLKHKTIMLGVNMVCITGFLLTLMNTQANQSCSETIKDRTLLALTERTINKSKATQTAYTRKILIKTSYPIVLSQPYKINNEGICRHVPKITCIVMVHTSLNHFERKYNLRKTFNSTYYSPNIIRVVFLLGLTHNSTLQTMIEYESLVHQDIVQGYFMDTYHNLTNKGVMGLKWITEHCKNAEFVAKIDDDVFMNFNKIFGSLKFIKDVNRFLACNRLEADTNPIQRGINDTWYVHRDKFKRLEFYPYTSCSGLAVFISIDLIPLLYKAALISPFFWVDDFYLFGILLAKIHGVVHYGINTHISLNHQRTFNCFSNYGNKCDLLVGLTDPDNNRTKIRIWG